MEESGWRTCFLEAVEDLGEVLCVLDEERRTPPVRVARPNMSVTSIQLIQQDVQLVV